MPGQVVYQMGCDQDFPFQMTYAGILLAKVACQCAAIELNYRFAPQGINYMGSYSSFEQSSPISRNE